MLKKKLLNKKIWFRFSSKIRTHKLHMQRLFSKLKKTNKTISENYYGASEFKGSIFTSDL